MGVISDDEELADVALEEDFVTYNTVAVLLLLVIALDGILEDTIISPSSKKTPLISYCDYGQGRS